VLASIVLREASEHPAFPTAAVAATIVTWGVVSPLIKAASVAGEAMAFYRLLIGALVLLAVVALLRRPVRAAIWPWGLAAGLLFGVNLLCFVIAVKETTVANATLIGALQPAIVLIVAGPLFGELVTTRDVTAVAVAIAGIGVVIAASAGTPEWHPIGDLIAVGAVLTYTAYFLVSKRVRITGSALEYVTVVHVVAALVVTPAVFVRPSELGGLDARDIATILFFGLVSGTAGQLIIGWAHRFVDVSVSSLMMLGVPVVATIAAWAMLDESLGPVQIAGGMITLAAIGTMVWRRPASSAPTSEPAAPALAAGAD
jgi:drug/metabolite transporter (DMT)-like permease